MTDLIPRDAKHEEAFMDAVWSALKADTTDLRKQQRILAAIRAIPTIDPAAIREAALKEALDAVSRAAWKHNGDDSYSAGLEDGARKQNEDDYEAILALIGEKK